MIDIAPDTAAVGSNGACLGVDRRATEATEVDDEGVVPDAETTAVVTAAADRERQHVLTRVRDAGHDIGDIGALHDGERVSIHCAVVNRTRRVIARIRRGDDRTSNSGKVVRT
jgi:hypothetical protein